MWKAPGSSGKNATSARKAKRKIDENIPVDDPFSGEKWANIVAISRNMSVDSEKKLISSASKSVQVSLEVTESRSKQPARKLFDCAIPCENLLSPRPLSDIEESLDSTRSDPINDSVAEFAQYESMCANSPGSVNMDRDDIFEGLRMFVAKRHEQTQAKIAQLLDEDKEVISARIDEVKQHFMQQNKHSAVKTAKSNNLRINLMKKTLAQCPDTPGTKIKMRRAIDLYNSVRDGLDSPKCSLRSLNAPNQKLTHKNALSLKIQKQCLDLQD